MRSNCLDLWITLYKNKINTYELNTMYIFFVFCINISISDDPYINGYTSQLAQHSVSYYHEVNVCILLSTFMRAKLLYAK